MPQTSSHSTAHSHAAGPALSGDQIGSKLWSMANTLRAAGVRPADYQSYILPALMFKVVCDRNRGAHEASLARHGRHFVDMMGDSVLPFTVPAGCSFDEQRTVAQNLGESLTTALTEIEKHNVELAGVFLGTDFAGLSDTSVRELYQVLSQVSFSLTETSQDALGRAYEYLLGRFADEAGAKAGQFFTPHCVAQLLVRLVDPQPNDEVYDPACGSASLLNTTAEHVAGAGHERTRVALFGQELDSQSHAVAKVNMFLHRNAAEIRRGDTLADPKFVAGDDLRRFDVVVANPPFGMANTAVGVWDTDRFGRFRWGKTVKKPSDLAFVAHMASSLKGVDDRAEGAGRAAIVLPMGALFRGGAEGETRKRLLEAGLVDAVIALPENLFYNTSIPASVLVLRADRRRDGQVLFVDASQAFAKTTKQNTLTTAHVEAVAAAFETASAQGEVRTKLVPTAEIVAAGSDLTVDRWLPTTSSDAVDVPAAVEALRAAESDAGRSSAVLWRQLQEAGYGA